MTRLRRVAVSFASAIAADVIVAVVLCALRPSPPSQHAVELTAIYFLYLVIPVWLLALPILLSFNRLDGWRLWALAVIGVLLGPVGLKLGQFTSDLYFHIGQPWVWSPLPYDVLSIALGISALSTIFYLGTLTIFHRRSRSPRTE